ncbi:MAG: hypothetical protein QG597_3508 [Actinomycetota bacterium]|nr:hypothetical protein [Actinomycetota bacterium]
MTRVTEQINPVSYDVELVREGDKVVEIHVRAHAGSELTHMDVRGAMQAALRRVPRRSGEWAGQGRGRLRLADRQSDIIEELGLPAHEMRRVLNAYDAAGGRITDVYLANLAMAYEIAARDHRDVSLRLAAALDRPLQTVKGHLVRARKEGFLSPPAGEGREGGVATAKAKDVIVSTPVPIRAPRNQGTTPSSVLAGEFTSDDE